MSAILTRLGALTHASAILAATGCSTAPKSSARPSIRPPPAPAQTHCIVNPSHRAIPRRHLHARHSLLALDFVLPPLWSVSAFQVPHSVAAALAPTHTDIASDVFRHSSRILALIQHPSQRASTALPLASTSTSFLPSRTFEAILALVRHDFFFFFPNPNQRYRTRHQLSRIETV